MLNSIQAGDTVLYYGTEYTVFDMADSVRGRVIVERNRDGKLLELNVEDLMENGHSIDEPVYEVEPDDEDCYAVDMVYRPHHYADREVEAIDLIEFIIDGLPVKEGMLLSHVLRYALRAGIKTPDWTMDAEKANNYAHRLITGDWRK